MEKFLRLYRGVVLIYMLFWWFESMIRFYRLNKIWPIMFTHWTTTMQIIDLLYKYFKNKKQQQQLSTLTKLTLTSSILVTVLFWVLVLPAKKRHDPTFQVTIGEVHAHGVNLLVCVLEIIYFFLINFKQLKTNLNFYLNLKFSNYKNTFIGLQIYITVYFLFAIGYWLLDKEKNVIYEAINFNNPKNAIFISSFIFFIISPFFIFLAFLIESFFKSIFMRFFFINKTE